MRDDYIIHFIELKSLLSGIGGVCVDDAELRATFLLSSGWLLYLECENIYSPGLKISIKNNPGERGYALWLLMKVFEGLTGKDYGRPTIYNQVEFLKREGARVFGEVDFYLEEYRFLNG